jgi:GWxTD domain-containing protein
VTRHARFVRAFVRCLVVTVAVAAGARVSRAQRPPGADTISAQAVADSLAVLDQLADQISHDRRNAALWFRQGMIAWALYDRDRVRSGVASVDWTRIGRLADTSLRIAKSLEPNNPRYILGAGQYFLGTGLITMRAQSYGMFGDALAISRAANDAAVHAEAALEVGRVYWRRYDAVANTGYTTSDAAEVRMLAQALSKDTSNHAKGYDPERATKSRPYTRRTVATARHTLDRSAQTPVHGFVGEADYLEADKFMREAFETLPTYPRAYQQLAMLLSERSRWTELEALAQNHLSVVPRDPWTWMTLGLAGYKQGDTRGSQEAFANGLKYMSGYERNRLDHLERVLRPSDTLSSSTWTSDERASKALAYWMDVDPLWSLADIDPRAEFLARVAYAELRWTVEELSQRGADSDRGNVYVRYGPPDRIASADGKSDWTYDFSHLRFRFTGTPTFGTANFADFGRAHDTIDSLPATWDNTHLMQIDSIPVQAARFRATGDSVDVFFAARAPIEGIRRATDISGPVRGDFWLMDTTRAIRLRDSTRLTAPQVNATTRRVAPGTYTYRLEATAEASLVAGRSVGRIAAGGDSAGFPAHGFGMSDVVLATRVEARATPPARWNEIDMAAAAGPLPHGGQLSLVWENYEFASREGASAYRVTITIARERSRVGRIAAQLIGALAGKRDASLDRVQMQVDRSVASAPILADQITMSLGATPSGSYMLTLEIMDLVSGKSVERNVRVVIDE